MKQLLAKWAPRAYRFALRLTLNAHLAEELTQEALLRAWQKRKQLQDPSRIQPWLFRIVANLWHDHLRRTKSPVAAAEPFVELPDRAGHAPEERMAQQEELQRALQAMDQLPTRQRQVLYLSACEELSTREIAEIVNITPEAVKASLSIARQKMRQQLGDGRQSLTSIDQEAP